MNCFDITDKAFEYLSFRKIEKNDLTLALTSECLNEIDNLNSFQYVYSEYDKLLPFLNKEPYLSFLNNASGYYLVATTLGATVDRLIKKYAVDDMLKAIIFDSVSSAYLEVKADEYEKNIAPNLSYRFCPGYQGSDVRDIKYIFDLLHPEKIGIELLPSGMMTPQKSMCGIVAIGKTATKNCGNCLMLDSCSFRKEGKRCYSLAKK